MKGAVLALCVLVFAQVALAQVADDSNKSRKGCLQVHVGNTPVLIDDYYFEYEKESYVLTVDQKIVLGEVNLKPYKGDTNFRVQGWDNQRRWRMEPEISGVYIDRLGNIMGTPDQVSEMQDYIVTQETDYCGTYSTVVKIAVLNAPPKDFHYDKQYYEFDVCHFIPRLYPSVGPKWSNEQRSTLYSTSGLPDGLKISPETGVIYGMVANQPPASWIVTVYAENDKGDTSTQLNIAIRGDDRPPRAIYYWHFPIMNITRGRLMYPWCPKHCGQVDEYEIKPKLPAGLQFDSSSGCITGTPEHVQFRKKYIVTANNQHGHANTLIRLRVWEAPKYLLKRLGWAPETL